jgi:hypothetical protein
MPVAKDVPSTSCRFAIVVRISGSPPSEHGAGVALGHYCLTGAVGTQCDPTLLGLARA